MNNWYDDIDDDSCEELKYEEVDIEKMKVNIVNYPINKLCEIVAVYRYLNFGEEAAVICMQELARRRSSGDTTKFEHIIDNMQKELPPLDFSMPDMRLTINKIVASFKGLK